MTETSRPKRTKSPSRSITASASSAIATAGGWFPSTIGSDMITAISVATAPMQRSAVGDTSDSIRGRT